MLEKKKMLDWTEDERIGPGDDLTSQPPLGIIFHTAKTKYRYFETNIPRKGISGLSPNFHIHASVSDSYIPTIGLPILLEEICRPILGLYKSLTDT